MADATLSTYLAAYLASGFVLLAWLAYWLEDESSIRAAFLLTILWPLTLLVAIPVVLLEGVGWRVDIEHRPDLSTFGYRRRNTGLGWALRCLHLELQVWRDEQEPRPNGHNPSQEGQRRG